MGAKEREICDQDGHEWEEWDDMLSGDLHISACGVGQLPSSGHFRKPKSSAFAPYLKNLRELIGTANCRFEKE